MLWFKICIAALAIASPFFFPIAAVIIITVIASLFVPLVAIAAGCLVDTLYFGGAGVPYFTLLGALLSIASYFVQQFIKTRII